MVPGLQWLKITISDSQNDVQCAVSLLYPFALTACSLSVARCQMIQTSGTRKTARKSYHHCYFNVCLDAFWVVWIWHWIWLVSVFPCLAWEFALFGWARLQQRNEDEQPMDIFHCHQQRRETLANSNGWACRRTTSEWSWRTTMCSLVKVVEYAFCRVCICRHIFCSRWVDVSEEPESASAAALPQNEAAAPPNAAWLRL